MHAHEGLGGEGQAPADLAVEADDGFEGETEEGRDPQGAGETLLDFVQTAADLVDEGHDEGVDVGDPDLEQGGVLDVEAAACPQARLAVAQVVVGDGFHPLAAFCQGEGGPDGTRSDAAGGFMIATLSPAGAVIRILHHITLLSPPLGLAFLEDGQIRRQPRSRISS